MSALMLKGSGERPGQLEKGWIVLAAMALGQRGANARLRKQPRGRRSEVARIAAAVRRSNKPRQSDDFLSHDNGIRRDENS